MLGALEQRLLDLVADAVEGLEGVTVGAAGHAASLEAGAAQVRVGIVAVRPLAGFEPTTRPAHPGSDEASRVRHLRLGFEAGIEVSQQPAEDSEDGVAAGRRRALDVLTVIGHTLDAAEVRAGAAFADGEADPGFQVTEFAVESGEVPEVGSDGVIRARWSYGGIAAVWPPGAAEAAGVMESISLFAAAEPLAIHADEPVVPLGGGTAIRVRGLSTGRHRLGDAPTRSQRLAVRIVSRLSATRRGRISSGEAGAVAGMRIVPVAQPETVLAYRGPASLPSGEPTESIEVFLARDDGTPGLRIGSIAIRLAEAS